MIYHANKQRINLVAVNDVDRLKIIKIRDLEMNNCEDCRFRAKYDNVCFQKVLDRWGIKRGDGFRFQIPFFSLLSNL